MSVNHEFEVVEKEVVFTAESPVNPVKLFTVNGDVYCKIVSIIKVKLSNDNATLLLGEQGKRAPWSMDSDGKNPRMGAYKAMSGDIYQTVRIDEGENNITSGTVVYYCIFAKLSIDGEVEATEE